MSRKVSKDDKVKETEPLIVDEIVLTASIVGVIIVIAASIGAGDRGLAANVTTLVTTASF